MDLSKVMAISGKSGLYKIVSQSRGGVIVESLSDGKKMPVFATHRSSVLEDISIFTMDEDIPLKNVLWEIYQKESGEKVSIDSKSNADELRNYFLTILPDYDQDRVYPSDIKKVLAWYNLLLEHDLISQPVDEEEKPAVGEAPADESTREDESAKTGKKKQASQKEDKKQKKDDKE